MDKILILQFRRRIYLLGWLTIFLGSSLFSSRELFSQNRIGGKDYAVFFVNANYQKNKSFEDLKNPIRDAQAIAKVLKEDYGFEIINLFKDFSKAEINQELKKLRDQNFGEADQLFIFFSGHGHFDDFTSQGYYITNGEKDNEFPLMTLGSIIDLINCPHILLMIDACYAGTIFSEIAFKGNSRHKRPGESSKSELEIVINNMLKYPSRLVITSGGKERVKDGTDHSPFTEAILKGLRSAYTFGDGLFTYVDLLSELERVSPKPHQGELSGHKDGGFVFVSNHNNKEPQMTNSDSEPNNITPRSVVDTGLKKIIEDLPVKEQKPAMLLISQIAFMMGSNLGEAEPNGASPTHLVKLGAFYLSPTEVTFSEYDLFCEATGREKPTDAGWGRGDLPVINISWFDAIAYCNWLSRKDNLQPVYQINGNQIEVNWSANGYRLPTEAEWEAAAKLKNQDNTLFANGKNEANPTEINFDPTDYRLYKYAVNGIFRAKTLPVKSLAPCNGFYHLSGNVAEWCYDSFSHTYYRSSPANDPTGPYGGNEKVVRGGSWASNPNDLRTWVRKSYSATYRSPQIGFRIARNSNK